MNLNFDDLNYRLLNATLTTKEFDYATNFLNGSSTTDNYVDVLCSTFNNTYNSLGCFPFMGGRSSLYAIVKMLKLAPTDEILVPAFTCQCLTNAIKAHNIQIKFIDIELETYGIDLDDLKRKITSKSKAIIIQHTFGLIARNLLELIEFAKQHNLIIIEDCAHSMGATFHGRLAGTFGDIAFFSSGRSKIINSIHGGVVIINNQNYLESMQQVYNQSPIPPDDFTQKLMHSVLDPESLDTKLTLPPMFDDEYKDIATIHYQYRMNDSIAYLCLLQLENLKNNQQIRNQVAMYWHKWAETSNLKAAPIIAGIKPTWLRYPIMIAPEIKRQLIDAPNLLPKGLNLPKGVAGNIGIWFSTPAHPKKIILKDCSNGMLASSMCINLPTLFKS